MKKMTLKTLETRVDALIDLVHLLTTKIETLESKPTRDRGPKSSRDMTEDDARRLILGDLVGMSHKAAAAELGLSYGQVYSARGGYTFKKVMDEKIATKK